MELKTYALNISLQTSTHMKGKFALSSDENFLTYPSIHNPNNPLGDMHKFHWDI